MTTPTFRRLVVEHKAVLGWTTVCLGAGSLVKALVAVAAALV